MPCSTWIAHLRNSRMQEASLAMAVSGETPMAPLLPSVRFKEPLDRRALYDSLARFLKFSRSCIAPSNLSSWRLHLLQMCGGRPSFAWMFSPNSCVNLVERFCWTLWGLNKDIAQFAAMSDFHRRHVQDSIVFAFFYYIHVCYTMTFHYTPILAYGISVRTHAKPCANSVYQASHSLTRKAWVRG